MFLASWPAIAFLWLHIFICVCLVWREMESQLDRARESQRQQIQQADTALEQFKKQVELSSEKAYADMKLQVWDTIHSHCTYTKASWHHEMSYMHLHAHSLILTSFHICFRTRSELFVRQCRPTRARAHIFCSCRHSLTTDATRRHAGYAWIPLYVSVSVMFPLPRSFCLMTCTIRPSYFPLWVCLLSGTFQLLLKTEKSICKSQEHHHPEAIYTHLVIPNE